MNLPGTFLLPFFLIFWNLQKSFKRSFDLLKKSIFFISILTLSYLMIHIISSALGAYFLRSNSFYKVLRELGIFAIVLNKIWVFFVSLLKQYFTFMAYHHDRTDHVCWSTLERIQVHIYHFQWHPSFEKH